ncbi:MAG: hypothetical protein IJL89_05635, partial [Firmicutes bacterium]|nr:hypothetical protein [Bacillota bacterium]
ASKFSDIDSTTVKERTEKELEKYITEDEYMAQQSDEGSDEEPSGTPLTPEEMEEMGLDPELYDAEIITEAAAN